MDRRQTLVTQICEKLTTDVANKGSDAIEELLNCWYNFHFQTLQYDVITSSYKNNVTLSFIYSVSFSNFLIYLKIVLDYIPFVSTTYYKIINVII